MAYSPVHVETFPGLDLTGDPGEAGCIDMLNVDLGQRGRIRTRDGVTKMTSATASGTGDSMVVPATFSLTPQLVHLTLDASSVYLDSVATNGSRTVVGNWSAIIVTAPARIGTPTTELMFVPTVGVGGGNLLRKYSGSTIANSVGKPICVGVLPGSNRLAQAGYLAAADSPSGANGSRSTIFFSDPGAPETYGANNYLHLQPGDGEVIQALVTWREYLFVFKQSTLFIFSSTSTDSTGSPIFTYRPINLPDPLPGGLTGALTDYAVAGRDGVYFSTVAGIYRTDGGQPQLISGPVAPAFDGTGAASLLVPSGRARVSMVANHLFARYNPAAGGCRTLVWDSLTAEWVLWGTANAGSPPVRFADYTVFSETGNVYRYSTATTDPGSAAIASYYQSGWTDFGSPESKRITKVIAWGSGTPTLSLFTDRGSTDANANDVTLGTAPAVARGVRASGVRGREISWKLAETATPWSLSSLDLMVADKRVTA